jgi:predicted AAA+ superfamily ATPase
LDTFRQSGDSLAGSCFHHRLLPISPAEARASLEPRPLAHFLSRGGFPEPFLATHDDDALRWRNQYLDGMIREDILTFDSVRDLRAIQNLFELLRERVGSRFSAQSAARDLAISPSTVVKYLEVLESLYLVFTVRPFSKQVSRSLLKEPKVYFFDTGLVRSSAGARLCHLKTKEGRDVDFALVDHNDAPFMVEVKSSETTLSPHLPWFQSHFGFAGVQLVADLRLEEDRDGLQVRRLLPWLESLTV